MHTQTLNFKKLMAIFAVLIGLTMALNASAAIPQYGTALTGYDAVAYQTQNRAVRGDTNHVVYHNGLAYMFANKANANTFRANPGKYEPAFNGYCAMGVALGKKLPGDPEAFRIVDGRLYLNLNKKVQKLWSKDIPGNITKANNNWSDIKDTHPDKL